VAITAATIETAQVAEGSLDAVTLWHVLEHNPYGMWQSVANRFTDHPSYLYDVLKRNEP
jgi:hypothetical protein